MKYIAKKLVRIALSTIVCFVATCFIAAGLLLYGVCQISAPHDVETNASESQGHEIALSSVER